MFPGISCCWDVTSSVRSVAVGADMAAAAVADSEDDAVACLQLMPVGGLRYHNWLSKEEMSIGCQLKQYEPP